MPRNILRVESFQPTIGSAYRAVEGYLEYLQTASAAPPLPLPPVDALLIHLLALTQPARPYVVDFAAVPTGGVSTVLCRTDPAMRQVVAPRADAKEPWRSMVEDYLQEWGDKLVEYVEVEETREALQRVANPQAPALVIAASAETFVDWLELVPRAVLVLLDAGRLGDSSSLASLAARCTGSSYRLALPRELAPALGESRIALAARRDNVDFESNLIRIGHLFTNQFPILNLIKRICDSALEQSMLNDLHRQNQRGGVLDPHSWKTNYDLRRDLAQREEELRELRQNLDILTQSMTFRAIQRVRRLVQVLAPHGSSRRRLAQMARSALHVLHRGHNAKAEEKPTNAHLRRAS
ncbi:MAG: hypothetical protein ACYC3I_02440 [Gemmataceae bacterium]